VGFFSMPINFLLPNFFSHNFETTSTFKIWKSMFNPTKCICFVTIQETRIGQIESLHFSKWEKKNWSQSLKVWKIDANLKLS